jgi:hypothetical protein
MIVKESVDMQMSSNTATPEYNVVELCSVRTWYSIFLCWPIFALAKGRWQKEVLLHESDSLLAQDW